MPSIRIRYVNGTGCEFDASNLRWGTFAQAGVQAVDFVLDCAPQVIATVADWDHLFLHWPAPNVFEAIAYRFGQRTGRLHRARRFRFMPTGSGAQILLGEPVPYSELGVVNIAESLHAPGREQDGCWRPRPAAAMMSGT